MNHSHFYGGTSLRRSLIYLARKLGRNLLCSPIKKIVVITQNLFKPGP
jgi:hypothetical protein